jgi:hypothetical protein
MADVNKSISINFEGKTDDLQAQLKKIPQVTKQAALKMASQINTALDKAAKRAAKVTKAMSASFKKVGASATSIGIASAAAGAAVYVFAQRIADLNNQLTDASTRSGLAIDTLAGLKLAAEGSGLAFENLERGLNRFPQAIQAARDGSKPIIETFDQLGITIDDLESQDVDKLFKRVAREIGKIQDPAQKAAASMRLFGGAAGAGLLQSGALENLQAFVDLTQQFGLETGPNAVQEAANFQRAVAELGTVAEGLASDFIKIITQSGNMSDGLFKISDQLVFMGTIANQVLDGVIKAFDAAGSEVFNFATDIVHTMQVANLALEGNFTAAQNLNRAYELMNKVRSEQNLRQFSAGLDQISNASQIAVNKLRQLQDQREKILSGTTPTAGPTGETEDETAITDETKNRTKAVDALAAAQQRVLDVYKTTFRATLDGEAAISQKYFDQIAALEDLQREHGATLDISLARSELEFAMEKELAEYRQQQAEARQAQRDAENNDIEAKLAAQKQAHLDLLASIGSSAVSITNSISTVVENVGAETIKITKNMSEAEREAARQRNQEIRERQTRLFMATKAAGMAEVAINTAIAVSDIQAAYAAFPPIAGALTALAVASGAAQIAAIQSQPVPKFDVGGMVGRASGADVMQASVLSGEAVLDRATVRRLGGEDGINALQRGDMPQQQVVVVQPFKHFDKFMQASSRRGRYNTGRRKPLGVGSY